MRGVLPSPQSCCQNGMKTMYEISSCTSFARGKLCIGFRCDLGSYIPTPVPVCHNIRCQAWGRGTRPGLQRCMRPGRPEHEPSQSTGLLSKGFTFAEVQRRHCCQCGRRGSNGSQPCAETEAAEVWEACTVTAMTASEAAAVVLGYKWRSCLLKSPAYRPHIVHVGSVAFVAGAKH